MTAAVITPRAREEKNVKFGNDASLASVELLLQKLAMKCYARVQAVGIGMEFDDVLQEMRISYVRAARSWNPEGGALFATYCQTACLNNFNNVIKKMERQRTIGKINPDDPGAELDEKGQVKFQREFGMVSECEFTSEDEDGYNAFHQHTRCDSMDLPDARLDRAAALKESLSGLSAGARMLVAELLKSERREAGDDSEEDEGKSRGPMKLREAARAAGLSGAHLAQVKAEIANKFGVTWF